MHTCIRPHLGLAALALAFLLPGCTPKKPSPTLSETEPPPPKEVKAAALARGKEIVSQAGQALSTVLLEAIRQGGPTNALPLCSVQAIPLTTSLAQANNVRLRRVSHKARNPINRANTQELEVIRRFQESLGTGVKPTPEVVPTPAGSITFYAPIILAKELCLNCHGQPGDTLQPELPPILARLYPEDEAIGFKLNDLRGMWRIDFPEGSLE